VATFLVHVNQVDVRRHVQLTRAELAHADHPKLNALAQRIQRRTIARVVLSAGMRQGEFKRHFGQLGHGQRDIGHGAAAFHIQHRQTFQHALTRYAHGTDQRAAFGHELPHQRLNDIAARQARRQFCQLFGVTATYALDVAAVISLRSQRIETGRGFD
jgi:hypothetical protein